MNLLRANSCHVFLELLAIVMSQTTAAVADSKITATALFEAGRPSNVFKLEQSNGPACVEIAHALNSPSKHEGQNPSDMLLSTGWEVEWTEAKFRTMNGRTAKIYVSDIHSDGSGPLRLFNLRSRYAETLYESLFYVSPSDEIAALDEGGALRTEFVAEHTKERSKAAGVVTMMPYVDALFGTTNSELRAPYQPGNHFTANVISLHGEYYALIGPYEMFLNYELLRSNMPIFVTKIPQDVSQSFCRLTTR